MQYFNIQVASQLSGVASATIRAWEKRYCAVNPDRGDNGHRLYSDKDIEKLALLFRLTEIGQSIGKIAHLQLDELKSVYSTLMHEPYDEKHVVTPNHERVDCQKILMNLQLALHAYKVDVISHELDKARLALTPREFCIRVIIPLFQEIGEKVARHDLSIAQEHTVSALAVFYLGQTIGSYYQKVHQKEELIILGTPEGELHAIGTLAASLLCVHYGIRFIFMGPNLPAESLAEAANALKAKIILLGSTRYQLKKDLNLNQYLHDLQGRLLTKVDIWIGGDNFSPLEKQELKKIKLQFFPTVDVLDDTLSHFLN